MPVGLLFATMEPPANIEEEFQDWYDSEHFPERKGCPGFLTAQRFVCIDGWPRYLAMYDLEDVEVLRGEGYRRIAHAKYSAWTHRIMSKVWGQYRAEGVQVYPGDALHGKRGASSRTAAIAFMRLTGTSLAASFSTTTPSCWRAPKGTITRSPICTLSRVA